MTEIPARSEEVEIMVENRPYEPKYRVPAKAININKIVTLHPTDPQYPLRHPFEDEYKVTVDFEMKYVIAKALIEDGRYREPQFLTRYLIAPGQQLSPGEQELAKELKDRLTVMLMKNDAIAANSEEAKDAQEEVTRFIDRDELLKKLRTDLPIHVMGAITNALMFDDVPDEQKREKLRSWTTKSLLRPYLGDLLVQRSMGDLDLRELVAIVPDKIFSSKDGITLGIIRGYFLNQAMGMFIDGEETGFQRLRAMLPSDPNDVRRYFVEDIIREFEEIQKLEIPPKFRMAVEGWFSDTSPFPLFRQKYFVHQFLKTRRKLLNGDTGATKTACAYLSIETVGARRVTIFGPARARNTWPKEADKIFLETEKPDVFTLNSIQDFDNPRIETAPYVYVGSELMARAWNDQVLYSKIRTALVERRKTDGVIFDESDEFRHERTGASQMLMDLVTRIRENYGAQNVFELPTLALTATPISSSLEDLDITMALLYPERFSLPRKYEDGKFTFSTQTLKDPQIGYYLLFGEQLMVQWSLEDLFGDKAPKLEYKRVNIPLNPAQNVIYEWVAGLQLGTLAKVRLLRSVLLNPDLIKRTCIERGVVPAPVYDQVQMAAMLNELHNSWIQWTLEKDTQIPDQPFSADWIAKYGEKDLILQCFFDESLADGIESLVNRFPIIRQDWRPGVAVSGKYLAARQVIEAQAQRAAQGLPPNEKIFFVSPYHKRGITRWLDDPNTKDEDLADNAWSFYEIMCTEWLGNLPREVAINIDGSRSFAFRDREATVWRENGDRNLFVIASMESVYESADWAIRNTVSNQNIKKLKVVYLGWPWGWDEFKQMSGRFLRPGQSKPVEIEVYESQDTIDQGFYDLVRRKYLLTQMALAGVELDKEDLEFFRNTSAARRVLEVQPTVGQVFLQDTVRKLRGVGENQIVSELSQQKNGKTFFDLFAEFYYDEGKDEFRIVGNNAELVKNIVLRSRPRKILSVGAGTALFARKVARSGYQAEIDNVDINGSALRIAQEKHSEIGSIKVEGVTKLSAADSTYDAVDCSFMLHWTKLLDENGARPAQVDQIERVKALTEIFRVLTTGATAVFTFPESVFDIETFGNFAQTLEAHFGASVVTSASGVSLATDLEPKKRIGWIVTAQKTGEVNLEGLDLTKLIFVGDSRTKVSKYRAKDESSKVVRIEYPIFSSRNFEVHNPLTREKSTAGVATEIISTVDFQTRMDNIKGELSAEQWDWWRGVRRDIEGLLKRNYSEAEEVLAGILIQRGLDRPGDWDSRPVQRIVEADIRRLLRENGNGNSH